MQAHRYCSIFLFVIFALASAVPSSPSSCGPSTDSTRRGSPQQHGPNNNLLLKNIRPIGCFPYSRTAIETRGGADILNTVVTGDEPSRSNTLRMSFLVKLHGVTLLPFAAMVLMESFGMELPYIGCAAILAGWDRTNPSLMAMTRAVAAFSVGLGLAEMRYGDSVDMQSIWRIYHVPLVGLTIYSSIDYAKGLLGWLPATIFSAFFIAGTIAK